MPLEVFGGWRAWLANAAEAASAPVDYVALGLMTCAGSLAGNAIAIHPEPNNPGWEEPPALWGICVGQPSSGKTPALAPFEKVLDHIESRRREAFEPELQDYLARAALAAQANKAWEEEAKRAYKKKVKPPPRPEEALPPPEKAPARVIVRSATLEALSLVLKHSPKGVLQFSDELAAWFGDLSRYSGSSDRPHWLSMHKGSPITVDRVKFGGSPLRVARALVSILGGIQPERLVEVLESPDDGLTSRPLYVWPDPSPLKRSKLRSDMAALQTAFEKLAGLEMVADPDGQLHPSRMTFTEDAANAFFEFRRVVHEMLQAEEGHMAGWIGKGPGCVARIAGILSLLDWTTRPNAPLPRIIQLQTVERAIALWLGYLLPMARRTFGDAARPEEEKKATRLLREIRRRRPPHINEREIYRDWKVAGLRSAKEVKEATAYLSAAGWLRESPSRSGDSPGRAKGNWMINPELWA